MAKSRLSGEASIELSVPDQVWSWLVANMLALEITTSIILILGAIYAVVTSVWKALHKPKVNINPTVRGVGDKLGFTIEVKRRNLNGPQAWYNKRHYEIYELVDGKAETRDKGDALYT